MANDFDDVGSKPVLVTRERAEEAIRSLAEFKGVSVDSMRGFLDKIGKEAFELMEQLEKSPEWQVYAKFWFDKEKEFSIADICETVNFDESIVKPIVDGLDREGFLIVSRSCFSPRPGIYYMLDFNEEKRTKFFKEKLIAAADAVENSTLPAKEG